MWRTWLPPVVAAFLLFGLFIGILSAAFDLWPKPCAAAIPKWFRGLPDAVVAAWFFLTLPGLIGVVALAWTGTAYPGLILGSAVGYFLAGWLAHGAMALLRRGLTAMRGGGGP